MPKILFDLEQSNFAVQTDIRYDTILLLDSCFFIDMKLERKCFKCLF